MKLKDYLSAYEGEALISVTLNSKGYLCHGIAYEDIRKQAWYDDYADKYVISFKVVKDEKVNNEIVLLLMM
ncbi:hypothetical protein [Butyrivibrio sp. XBB1001]|uniref:hypothetical protein n=1 Tax=Butyrivibrio sp. XBB1001 TaxID=1280682 RepID=UPI00040FB48A|nr:hypothetical protein [Butyrivibrio sp. XBB1001]